MIMDCVLPGSINPSASKVGPGHLQHWSILGMTARPYMPGMQVAQSICLSMTMHK